MKKMYHTHHMWSAGAGVALLLAPLAQTALAQDASARAEIMAKALQPGGRIARIGDPFSEMFGGINRAVIGVTTSSGGNDRSDTLGVLVESVTAGSPAEKAGIKQGNRITSVNGVSLRISSLDADDPELQGLGQRRLIRELGKVKVGDEVELRVSSGTASQTLRLKTVSPSDLSPARRIYATPAGMDGVAKRASIGAAIGSTGSVRDTLGIFISSVSAGGPAEKAGIVEGDRIAAINGVDVRVPHEDAEDPQTAAARVSRFTRELAKLAPGDKATLRIFGNGRYREVPVTTGNGSDSMLRSFQFNSGDGIRSMTLPGMRMENLPALIRGRSGNDTSRIVYRRTIPSANGAVIRAFVPATVRKVSQE